MYNDMLRLSYFPSLRKSATIIIIHKSGKSKHLVISYKSISLFSTLGKLFEKLLLERIRPIMLNKRIIPNAQFGFLPKHSISHQIHRLTDCITLKKNNTVQPYS